MKKIGIITIFDENNYGNRLQNYATQEVLKSLNFDVETINNFNNKANSEYFEKMKNILPGRREKFLDFNNENLKITKELIIHDEVPEKFHERYDYFVIGSDQIWNHEFYDRFSDFCFATFAPKEKRVSFSASFGISNVPENAYNKYARLNELKAISVREDAGKKIVERITERNDCVVLLDPTMMLSADKWSSVMKKPEMLKNDKSILKYFLGNVSKERNDEIERFAKEHDCEIIDVLDKESFYATGPSEFIYLIKNSFLVLTDSFHSCVFSIIFDRPFLIFERDEDGMRDMNSRIDTLLQKFELKNKNFTGKIDNTHLETNYTNVSNILSKEQEKVIEYLKNALDVK